MPLFAVLDIVRATRGALVAGDLGVPVTGVSIDSRALGVGEAFFAIRGHRLDGHAFLADAAGRGAACLVVPALHDDAPANVPLVRAVPPTGWVALNADDPRVAGMARDAKAHVVTYGRAATAQVRLVGDVVEDAHGLGFTLEAADALQPVTLAFAGRHNAINALAAAAVGAALGFTLEEIARGLAAARPVGGRGVWREVGGVRILDDTYNANPVSVRAALETVAARRDAGRLVAVLGDMLELGGIAEEAHREIGRAVVAAGADELVGVGHLALLALEADREAGLAEARHATTFEDTVAYLLKRLGAGDTVLVQGSPWMRPERVVDALVARLARE